MQSQYELALAPITRLQAGPREARTIIADILRKSDKPETLREIYRALQSAVWLLIASRDLDPDALSAWFEVVKGVGSGSFAGSVAQKMETLSELLDLSARVASAGAPRLSVDKIINAIRENGGSASFKKIEESTHIQTNTLAQRLWNLTAHGMVVRKGQGQKTIFSLP